MSPKLGLDFFVRPSKTINCSFVCKTDELANEIFQKPQINQAFFFLNKKIRKKLAKTYTNKSDKTNWRAFSILKRKTGNFFKTILTIFQ